MADRLGRTAAEIEDGMTYVELIEWAAYDQEVEQERLIQRNKKLNEQALRKAIQRR